MIRRARAHAAARFASTSREHVHTDIIGHSVDAFPARTAEEFLEFLTALLRPIQPDRTRTPSSSTSPRIRRRWRSSRRRSRFPRALEGNRTSRCRPSRFTNAGGVSRYGRYRVVPVAGNEYLDAAGAAAQSPDFLIDDIQARVGQAPVGFRIVVQVAEEGDVVDDATARWPESRPQLVLGELTLGTSLPTTRRRSVRSSSIPFPGSMASRHRRIHSSSHERTST